ncbi:MAG TPA: hypothetical protein VM600_07860, partial [Actinomycetota bacterium]|nr:hypothetical protein [Actinomycetota bacterium]
SMITEFPDDAVKLPWVLYSDAETTPTSVSFGTPAYPVLPESPLECRLRFDCAEIGGPRMLTALDCDVESTLPNHPTLRVKWTGPAGSTAGARCQGNVVTCSVPGEPATDPWGTCEAEVPMILAIDTYDSNCFYRTRDGAMVAGYGRCDGFPLAQEPQK